MYCKEMVTCADSSCAAAFCSSLSSACTDECDDYDFAISEDIDKSTCDDTSVSDTVHNPHKQQREHESLRLAGLEKLSKEKHHKTKRTYL